MSILGKELRAPDFGTVCAALERTTERSRALEADGLDEASWSELRAQALSRLAKSADEGGPDLEDYRAAFERPAGGELSGDAVGPSDDEASGPPSTSEVSGFSSASRPPSTRPDAAPPLMVVAPSRVNASFQLEQRPAGEAAAKMEPASAADSTGALDVRSLREEVLPFTAAAPSPPVSARAQADADRPASSRSFKTEALDLASLQRPVTPFTATPGTTPAAPAPGPWTAPASGDDGDQTAFIPRHRLAEAISTPPSTLAPTSAPPSSTLDITQPPLRRATGSAVPFRTLDPTEPLDMTIERYATVSAALAGDGVQEVVLARFGLTRDGWIAEMRRMSERFNAEPQLRMKYQELVRRALGQAI